MKKELILYLLLAISIQISAQNTYTLQGEIIDKNGLFPLGGVHIFEKKNSKNGTYSDENGYFRLTSIDSASILFLSFIGYQNLELRVAATLDDIPLIHLIPEIFELPY